VELFKFLLRSSKKTIFFSSLFGALSGYCSTRLVVVMHQAIDPNRPDPSLLLGIFTVMAVMFLISSLAGQIPMFQLSENGVYHMRLKLIEQINKTPLRVLEKVGEHRLYATLTSDVNTLSGSLIRVPQVLVNSTILLGCFIYLGMLSMTVLAGMVLFIFSMVFVFRIAFVQADKRLEVARECGDELFKQFRDVVAGAKEMKMHEPRRKALIHDHLEPTAATYKKTRVRAWVTFEGANTLGSLGYFLVIGFLIFAIPMWQTLSPEVISGGVLLFLFMMSPIRSLLDAVPSISAVNVALRKIDKLGLSLGENDHEETPWDQLPALDRNWSDLALQDMRHGYYNEQKDESFVLGPINLELKPAEIVFVIGGNGSGKSTLAKMITGLYPSETGRLTLDGVRIDEKNIDWYRQHFTTVFSDFYLLDRLLGIESSKIDEYAAGYLEDLHLDHKVHMEGNRLSTTQLSTGQRKRLALLYASLEDRPIYLFDEWASDQDPHFKKVFYTRLLPELKARGKCVITITHDDRYFHLADRVIKLEDGCLSNAELSQFQA